MRKVDFVVKKNFLFVLALLVLIFSCSCNSNDSQLQTEYPINSVVDARDILLSATLQYPSSNSEWKYSVYKDATNTYDYFVEITDYLGGSSYIEVPDTIDGYPVLVIGDGAFSNPDTNGLTFYTSGNETIEQVVLPEGLLKIGMSAFGDLHKLTTINLPDSIIEIGERAFIRTNISSINIPKGLTTISPYCFYATNIQEIIIPDNIVTIESNAFNYSEIKTANIPASVSYIGKNAFHDNLDPERLASLTIYGVPGSEAAIYCAENGINFVPVG